ncbi:hypothetical protein SprV_0702397300 [Sparganum proliferum]
MIFVIISVPSTILLIIIVFIIILIIIIIPLGIIFTIAAKMMFVGAIVSTNVNCYINLKTKISKVMFISIVTEISTFFFLTIMFMIMATMMTNIVNVPLVSTVLVIMILDIFLPSLIYVIQHFLLSFVIFFEAAVNFWFASPCLGLCHAAFLSASPSHLEKDLATCSHVYLRCDRVRRPLEPPYDGPFRVISRGTKNFRIQRGTREEVVSVDRLKAAVPDTPPDEPCGPLPPAPPPRPSIPPSRILPLPPCPPPTTPTTPSSTNNTTPTTPSAPLRATFGLAGGTVAVCVSLPRPLSRCLPVRLTLLVDTLLGRARHVTASRVLQANQRCPLSDWLADAETTEGADTRSDTTPRRRTQTTACCSALAATAYRALVYALSQAVNVVLLKPSSLTFDWEPLSCRAYYLSTFHGIYVL